jgi:hypothetical protein
LCSSVKSSISSIATSWSSLSAYTHAYTHAYIHCHFSQNCYLCFLSSSSLVYVKICPMCPSIPWPTLTRLCL